MVDVTLPDAVLKNSVLPRPITVDTRLPVLIYPRLPRPLLVDVIYSASVPIDEIYPNDPRPTKDEWSTLLLMYNSPRPSIVEVIVFLRVAELMYTCPKPPMLDWIAEELI